jgi:hypothetical protein
VPICTFHQTTAKRYSTVLLLTTPEARDAYCIIPPCSVPGCPKLTQFGHHHSQDGYTLERVDVYGLIDGVHETVVIPGAECYVGRNDNPSFSSCGLSLPHIYQRFTFLPKKILADQLVRSRSANFRMLSGVP